MVLDSVIASFRIWTVCKNLHFPSVLKRGEGGLSFEIDGPEASAWDRAKYYTVREYVPVMKIDSDMIVQRAYFSHQNICPLWREMTDWCENVSLRSSCQWRM
ncbi:hypothetical protein TNCV_3629681 [Trichonephila clavipes]|nr:hypothetical protein TNCV_3629681 [Trichonephila clavipes]